MTSNEIKIGNISFVFLFHFTNNVKQEINLSADSPLIETVEGALKTSQVPVSACANGR